MKNHIYSECKLCGKKANLNFEHIPPRNALNKGRYKVYENSVIETDPFLEKSKGKLLQGGIGFYSLCYSCNSNTGSWYGDSYISFTNQAVYRLTLSNKIYAQGDLFVIHPLKILKQILSFFISIAIVNYNELYPELTDFVLKKYSNKLPSNFSIYMYYNSDFGYRYISDNVILENDSVCQISEISYFPFGFILKFEQNDFPMDKRLIDITSWKNFRFESKDRLISIPPNKLSVVLPFSPLDYRTRNEIELVIKESLDKTKKPKN